MTSVDELLTRSFALGLGESDVAIVAEMLMGKNRGDRFATAPAASSSSGSSPSPLLQQALARILAAGCLRYLLGSGGAQARTVLRDLMNDVISDGATGRKQRRHGRMWDPPLNVGFAPAFSDMPMDFLWKLGTIVLPLVEKRKETLQRSVVVELTRDEKKALARARPLPATQPLDHVFCVLALRNKEALRLPDSIEALYVSRLVQASPLAALFYVDEAGDDDGGSDDIAVDVLLLPQHVRLLELCDVALGAALVRRLHVLWRSGNADELVRRCRRLRGRLQSWVRALDEAGRLDLLGPICQVVAAIPVELPQDARARLVRLAGVVTMADRDRVVAAVDSVVSLSVLLDELTTRMQAERYGDDRYEEAQLTLRVLGDVWAPRRDAVFAFSRALTGAVG